ncbi:MAG: TIGR03752 family integrating conjugative element protein, partial [Gammaproteobacteria bacterium]|nr:TIGR03752 family integrating conjugative element protein [Gammaproteobacteria bacterium]
MALASANRLLPWLAAILLALLGLVALRACSGDPARNVVMESVPRAPVPDADTPADTIKTLTANVAAMTAEVEALRQEGDRLRQENRDLAQERGRLEENLMRNLRR